MTSRLGLRAICLVVLFVAAARPATADPVKIAEAVPAVVAEAVTGGAWRQGDTVGTYRAVTLYQGEGKQSHANIVLQWIAFDESSGASIVQSTPIGEINDKKLPSAFVNLSAEADNEIRLTVTIVTAETDQEARIEVTAALPGEYRVQQ